MPNLNEINKMLRDFQNLIPQIVGSLVAIAALIGTIVGLLNEENDLSSQVKEDIPSVGVPSQEPFLKGVKEGWNVKLNAPVKLNDKEYTDSARALAPGNLRVVVEREDLGKKFRSLKFTAGWDENVVTSDVEENALKVHIDGSELNQDFTVKKGQVKEFEVNVTNANHVEIEFPFEDGVGMAIVNPTLYR